MIQQGSMPGNGLPDVTIADVRFEHHRDALGIGESRPRLSWIVATQANGWRQAGYEIEAYGSDGRLRELTGRVESDQSVLVPWPFAPLSSRERLSVRVRVWGIDGQPLAWGELAPVESGLLHTDDWSARFVTPDGEEDTTRPQPCPLLRREFDVRAGVTRARLYVTALGVYEVQLNGDSVGDHVLDLQLLGGVRLNGLVEGLGVLLEDLPRDLILAVPGHGHADQTNEKGQAHPTPYFHFVLPPGCRRNLSRNQSSHGNRYMYGRPARKQVCQENPLPRIR